MAHRIRAALPEHVAGLPGIETAAASRFADTPFWDAVLDDATPLEELQEAQRAGRLFVALEDDSRPVGFALVTTLDDHAHLDEVDVLPSHGRLGIGSGLVRAACRWARAAGLPALTLTTYREVPWNEPFYTKLGFAPLAPGELGPALATLVRRESAHGLRAEDRVVMRRSIGAEDDR